MLVRVQPYPLPSKHSGATASGRLTQHRHDHCYDYFHLLPPPTQSSLQEQKSTVSSDTSARTAQPVSSPCDKGGTVVSGPTAQSKHSHDVDYSQLMPPTPSSPSCDKTVNASTFYTATGGSGQPLPPLPGESVVKYSAPMLSPRTSTGVKYTKVCLEASRSTAIPLPPLPGEPGGSYSPTNSHDSSNYSHLPPPTPFSLGGIPATTHQPLPDLPGEAGASSTIMSLPAHGHASHYMHPPASPTTPGVRYVAVSHATSGSATPSLPPLPGENEHSNSSQLSHLPSRTSSFNERVVTSSRDKDAYSDYHSSQTCYRV